MWLTGLVYLLMAIVASNMQRGEEHSVLDVHVCSMLQENICSLVGR